ncbi:MAG: outer membrane beta-barrel protein [Nitrospira sp.]|nr:outer membrane beta-barrel protein [Nitrospira sp.]
MAHMQHVRPLFLGLALFSFLWAAPANAAEVQQARWGFATDLGLWTGTTNNTTFALGFGLDYYMDQNFSFGGMALFTPVGDLTQIGIAGVAKYHLRWNGGFNLVPFAGLGFLHADLNRASGPTKVDRNDTSHFIPLGLSLEYQMGPKIAFSTTLMVNLHHITLSPPVPNDNTSVALLFGIRWGP